MSRWVLMSALTAGLAGAVACDAESEVQRQTRELQAAQKDVGKETKRLEEELGRAQADVARVEQKLLLARQGLTDEVLENQKQLEEALKAQDQKVRDELNHAQREAQNHTRDTEAALKQLGQMPPPATSAPPPAPIGAPPPARDQLRREELLAVRGGPELGEGVDAGDDDVPPEAPSSTSPAAGSSAEPAPGQQSAPPAPTPAPPVAAPPAATPPEAAPPAPAPYGPPAPPVPPVQ